MISPDCDKDVEICNENIPCREHNVEILKSGHVFDMLVIGGGYGCVFVFMCVHFCVCVCVCVFVCMQCLHCI